MAGNDFPSLKFDLGGNRRRIRDAVRALAKRRNRARAADIDRDNQFPNELWRKLRPRRAWHTGPSNMAAQVSAMSSMSSPWKRISRASASVGAGPNGAHSNLCVDHTSETAVKAQKAEISAQADQGEYVGGTRHVLTRIGFRRGVDAPRADKKATVTFSMATTMWITQRSRRRCAGGSMAQRTDPAAGSKGITAFPYREGLVSPPLRARLSFGSAAPLANWCSRIGKCRKRMC